MNDYQRQILADELNEVLLSIERYEKAIAKLEHQISVKNENLDKLKLKRDKLKEGVD